MNNDEEEKIQNTLTALDEAINKGPWDKSNFLKVIGKNLRDIRDTFFAQVNQGREEEISHKDNARFKDHVEIFISLYASEGSTIASWERIIANLPRHVVSRPIYADENDVRSLIKSKENKINEAYLSVFIHPQDVLHLAPDKLLRDKFGKPLISLKDRSLNLDNILRFVHISGIYNYKKGRLQREAASEL